MDEYAAAHLEVTALSTLPELTPSPFTALTLDDESAVEFFQIVSDDDREGIGVFTSTPPGRGPITARLDFDELPPMEIFHALAPPDAPVPTELTDGYVEPKGDKPQGWARDLFAGAVGEEPGSATQPSSAALTSACARDPYLESLPNFGWAHGDTGRSGEIIEMNVGPSQNPWSWDPPPAGQDHNTPLWTHEHAVHNVDLFYTRVTICDLGVHAWDPYDHLGPYVIFLYRPAGNAFYKYAKTVIADVVGKSYGWFFYTGANWDWTTFIGYSAPGDRFNQVIVWGSTGA